MERLANNNITRGITATGLRTWGFLFLTTGIIGKGLIQNILLGLDQLTAQELLQAMNQSGEVMMMVTLSLVLQAVETCAVPIFSYLVVEGFCRTSSFRNYLLRVTLLAAACELPYNLAFSSKLFDLSTRNPAFGMVLCLVMMYYYRRFAGKKVTNILMRLAVTVAAVIWAEMFKVEHGSFSIIVAAALWAMRNKPTYRLFAGCGAAMLCCLISPFYMAAPMGFLAVYACNGEKGEENRVVNYLCYPGLLILCAAASFFF